MEPRKKKRRLNVGRDNFQLSFSITTDNNLPNNTNITNSHSISQIPNTETDKLSQEIKYELKKIFVKINALTVRALKLFLTYLKSLKSIDGNSILEGVSLTGKKAELQIWAKRYILMIYNKKMIMPSNDISYYNIYTEKIDFDSWKEAINQQIESLFISSTPSKSSEQIFLSRLNSCNKQELIQSIKKLCTNSQNTAKLDEILPSPNIPSLLKKHVLLINAIHTSRPSTKYIQYTDDYCYMSCKLLINRAKKTIIDDGTGIMKLKQWGHCLEYLIGTKTNIDKFPTWKKESNNRAITDLKAKLGIWYRKVKKGLGDTINDIQKNKLDQIKQYLNL